MVNNNKEEQMSKENNKCKKCGESFLPGWDCHKGECQPYRWHKIIEGEPRKCSKCLCWKKATTDDFYERPGKEQPRLSTMCRECWNKYSRARYEERGGK